MNSIEKRRSASAGREDESTQVNKGIKVLAERSGEGLDVMLLWDSLRDQVSVSVVDVNLGEDFRLGVEPDKALDAFNHPFAYKYSGAIAVSETFSQAAA